jgi:hypothetical protein
VGRCVSSDGNFWQYVGPILGFHVLLVVGTNILLCNVRDIADRYQEQKYVAMASALMLEILLVGIPVLVSVNDNAEATFIVLTAIVALDDICKSNSWVLGLRSRHELSRSLHPCLTRIVSNCMLHSVFFFIAVLSCIFAPKISFQRKGLQEGVQFGESIMRESHKRASVREYSRRSFVSGMNPSAYIQSSAASPEEVDESNASGHFQSSELAREGENDNDVPGGPQRRDSFLSRLQKKPSFFRSLEESGVESIVEETHHDLLQEMSDPSSEEPSEKKYTRNNSSSSSIGYMMTPAGMMDPNAFAALHRSGATTSSSGSSQAPQYAPTTSPTPQRQQQQQQQQPMMLDPQKAMEEQARMMEMTKRLMGDHERMMKATAEIMSEHKKLKEELKETKEAITHRTGDSKASELGMTGATEEGSNSSAESPQAAEGESKHT